MNRKRTFRNKHRPYLRWRWNLSQSRSKSRRSNSNSISGGGRTIEYHRAQIRSCTASGKQQLMMPRRSAIGCANKSCRESATPNASKAPSMTDAANCISSRPPRSVLTGWCVQRHGLTRKVSALRFLRDYRRTIRRPWTPCCNRRLMSKTASVRQSLKCRGPF